MLALFRATTLMLVAGRWVLPAASGERERGPGAASSAGLRWRRGKRRPRGRGWRDRRPRWETSGCPRSQRLIETDPKRSNLSFSRSFVSDSLRPHGPQQARPPFHHQLPELTQALIHRVGDAVQPSHPLSSPSPALNLSQPHGRFQGVRWPKDWSFSIDPSTNEATESDVRDSSPAACSGAPSPAPAAYPHLPPPQGWMCAALVTSLFPSEKSGSSTVPFHKKQGLELYCWFSPFSRQFLIPRVNAQ